MKIYTHGPTDSFSMIWKLKCLVDTYLGSHFFKHMLKDRLIKVYNRGLTITCVNITGIVLEILGVLYELNHRLVNIYRH